MRKKQEKMVRVFVLCPHDMEKPVLYFDTHEQALEFAKSYQDGASVSPTACDMPERIVRAKSMHIARNGHVL